MTQDEATKIMLGLRQTYKDNDAQVDRLEDEFQKLCGEATKSFKQARWQAREDLDKLKDDDKYIQLFCTFKRGEFARYGDVWLEVENASLVVDEDEPNPIWVRLTCWEIRVSGNRAKHTTTYYQHQVIKCQETDDKRLLRRIKKRIVERLEGNG